MNKRKPPIKRFWFAKAKDPLLSLLKYTFAALLIFIPLYPKFPLIQVPQTQVAVRLEDFLLAFLALLLFFYLLPRRHSFFSSLIHQSILLYWSIGLLSLISAIWVTRTVNPHLGLFHWARRVEYMLPFFAGVILAKSKTNLRFFTRLIPIVATGVLFYGLAQIYLAAPVISTQNEEFSKGLALTLQPGVNLASTFAGHYDLATYLVMTISLLLALLIGPKKRLHQLLGLLLLLALFWLQLRTGSRIAFFALPISVTWVLLLSRRPLWILPVVCIVIFGLANTPQIAGRFTRLLDILRFQYLQQQVKGIFDTRGGLIQLSYAAETLPSASPSPTPVLRPIQQDRSTSIRLDVEWPRALRALLKNPLLGTGYSSLSLATDNDYLRALGETGLLGFFVWLTLLLNLVSTLVQGLKKELGPLQKRFLIGTSGLFIGFLIIATFIDVFEASKVATLFWMYTGLASGLTQT